MTKRIAFLGFEIEEGKIQPGTKKFTTVENFPRLTV